METFDLVVIGAGPGGYPAAIRAAQLGASVAVVEKEFAGGTCLNWGCIPTKALIACADLYAEMGRAPEFGLTVKGVAFDYAAMGRRKNEIVGRLRGGVEALLKAHKVRVFPGTASFVDRRRVAVQAADGTRTTLEASSVIVAAGSVSAMPGFLPRHERILESRGFLDLTALPKSLLVLGGGVIGCEFACMAARLGVAVTVVELLDDILVMLDADVRRELRRHMETKLGVRILTGKPLEQVEAGPAGVSGRCGETRVEAELLLAAVGRRPVSEGLNLEAAGIKVNKAGFIPVDEYARTAAANVFAVGDVTGGFQLAHAATSQGITAAENACRKPQRKVEALVPSCIFTAPEIGSVGLTEQQAKEQGLAVKIGKYPFAHLGKAMAAGHGEGFVKWVADAQTDRLLGAHAIGPHATELIAEATLAIRSELTAEEAGRTIHGHPTLAETWMEAAHAAHGTCIHLPPALKR
jgi:dihydrolipoamide dehydrogenase